ncbi:MAG: alpha/beta hydrolase [Eubacteriales bacterium]
MGIILFFAVYNRIAISFEAKEITANGKLVEVGDYKIHVYAEGEKSDEPTLVFMSGSATVAPVYDFKILYSLLSDDYRIVVVEKLGYGYSDIVDTKRDVLSMVEETREALKLAGEEAPFVLLPHSMSGLEALYWAQNYPEEVKAVIGLDMAIPASMMR